MKLTKNIIKKLLVGSFLFTGVMGTMIPLQASEAFMRSIKEMSPEQRTEKLCSLIGNENPSINEIEALINAGVDINAKNRDGFTPLHLALIDNHPEIVKFLLERPEININIRTDALDGTPLHLAVIFDNPPEIVKLLLARPEIDINAIDIFGGTLLHMAAESDKIEIVEFLLKQSEMDINAKDGYGDTPLHSAARSGNFEIVEFLLRQPKIDINIRNNSGKTSLHLAAGYGHSEIVELLLGQPEIDNINAKDNDGSTPLHLAVRFGNPAIAIKEVFIRSRGRGRNIPVKQRRLMGGSILPQKRKDTEGREIDVRDDLVTRFLLAASRKGIEIDARDSHHKTPLDLAKIAKRWNVVELLKTAARNWPGVITEKRINK
ncbi:MAG: ankyrin repeat domain-containing protein [Puniceicoccales bacterium]|jgi:ankyrin repeat protein|nr:ankyrin repeat domain-containing protein [Puniceicoccales bacterium]